MNALLLRVAACLLVALLLAGVVHAEAWWERGADTWYYKDDWKGLALEGSRAYSKALDPPDGAAGGWIVVWGDRGYTLKVNGRTVGGNVDGGLIDDYDLTPFIEAGATKVTLLIEGSRVCAEGELIDAKGNRHPFTTGDDWLTPDGKKPRTRKLEPGPSHGAFHRAHNGCLMPYNDEERGKAAIARCLARIQRLNEQGIFLMRRLRPADDVLSSNPDVPWRRAERAAAPLVEKARGTIAGRAVPAQKAGRFAEAVSAATEAASQVAEAEAMVATVTELHRAEREMAHLENCWFLLGGDRGPSLRPPDMSDPGSPSRLREQAMKPLALGDWAAALEVVRAAQERSVQRRRQLEGAAARILGPLVGGLGHLDEFPEDCFGWLNARELMGNDPARWPFTIAPSACDCIDLAGLWDFHADPDNVGLDQLKDGWRTLSAPEPWERQGVIEDNPKSPGDCPYRLGDARTGDKPYNGFAWYRKSILVPAGWKGRKVVLATGRIANWGRVFVNGKPLGDGQQNPPATRQVPADLLAFGQPNLFAVQVYNHDNFGGIHDGPLALYLEGAAPEVVETPGPLAFVKECSYPTAGGRVRTTLIASAMSPAVLVATDGGILELSGWDAKGHKPPSALSFPTKHYIEPIPLERPVTVDLPEPGPGAVGLLLKGGDADTVIVAERLPRAVAWRKNALGTMSLALEYRAPVRAAILPMPAGTRLDEAACQFWFGALRAYPVAASQLVRPAKDATPPALDCSVLYNYSRLGDAFPVAPVPMLFSYGLKHGHPGLAIWNHRTTSYHSEHAPYVVVEKANAVRYRVPAVNRSKVMKGVGELFGKLKPEHNARGGLPEDVMFQRMGEWGFDHCRYAFAFHASWDIPLVRFMGGPLIEDNEAAWKRLDQLIEKTNAAGVQMMLCWFFNEDQPQADTGGAVRNSTRYWQAHPEAQRNAFELWRRLAARYADKPEWAISYDFFNEPAYMNPAHWNQVVKELTAIIRSVDKKHMIVWESADGWAQPHWCLWMEPAKDPNVLYSFHHYGKHWGYAYDEYYPGYKRTHEQTHIDPWFHAILFGIRHHVPIHCGEFGISMIQPAGSGDAWLEDYLAFFERFGIGWNWWNYSGQDIYRTGLAAGDRISPFVPVLRKWAERSGWGASRRAGDAR